MGSVALEGRLETDLAVRPTDGTTRPLRGNAARRCRRSDTDK
jgi:hypothetical protein